MAKAQLSLGQRRELVRRRLTMVDRVLGECCRLGLSPVEILKREVKREREKEKQRNGAV